VISTWPPNAHRREQLVGEVHLALRGEARTVLIGFGAAVALRRDLVDR
jgi:hypothetical protein